MTRPKRPGQGKATRVTVEYLLEQCSAQSIKSSNKHVTDLLRFAWDFYQDVAFQRAQIRTEIKTALQESAKPGFDFEGWQRAVKFKYDSDPLSTLGSLTGIGGRFNIGNINPPAFPPFPALYAGLDKDTALQEVLLGGIAQPKGSQLSSLDLALTNQESITIVAVRGHLDTYLDLRNRTSLQKFVALTHGFRINTAVLAAARRLKIAKPYIIGTAKLLRETLLTPAWRRTPRFADVPANCQVFGQLVSEAGIEGIVYPSRHTMKDSVAAFTLNFAKTASVVEIVGDVPAHVKTKRIDSSNCNRE